MKKKLLAVLLTLCMVLGMLPLSALAVWKTEDGKEIGTTTVADSTHSSFQVDGKTYYALTEDLSKNTGDIPYYYRANGQYVKQGELTWDGGTTKSTVTWGTFQNGTITVKDEGTTITSNTQVQAGHTVEITASPAANYELDTISVKGTSEVSLTGEGNTRTFVMPSEAVTISVTFAAKKFALNWAESFDNGSIAVTIDSDTAVQRGDKVEFGKKVTVKTTPASDDYSTGAVTVKQTSGDGTVDVIKSTDVKNTYTFTMPTYDATLSATFVKTQKITPPVSNDGKVDLSGTELQEDVEAVEIEITLGSGFNAAEDSVEVTVNADLFTVADDLEADATEEEINSRHVEISSPMGHLFLKGKTLQALSKKLQTLDAKSLSYKTDPVEVPEVNDEKVTFSDKKAAVEIDLFAILNDNSERPLATSGDEIEGIEVSAFFPVEIGNDKVPGLYWVNNGTPETVPITDWAEKAVEAVKGTLAQWVTSHFSTYVLDEEDPPTEEDPGTPGTPGTPDTPEDDGTPGRVTNSSGGGGGGSSVTHRIEVATTANGTIKVSPTTAAKGEKVTITVTPNEGYELDTLKAEDANKNALDLTKVDDSTCTFVMADTTVTVTGTFKKTGGVTSTGGDSFSDVPTGNTFYEDIMWVAGRGYMNGYSDGTFRPDSRTTRQALWMVLGRIDGQLNAESPMTAARSWAMGSNVSDGTNPENAMSRQQMVAMLYRYAQAKGYTTTGGVDISSYPDYASVADYAKDAMSWAVGNGIVQGTNAGTLNPEGTALRSHFAAFLHRFCQTAGIA